MRFCCKKDRKQAKKLYAARIFCVLAPKNIDIRIYVWYTDNGTRYKAYEYEYTADGQVHALIDNVNNQTTVYKYDNDGRLSGFVEFDNDDFYHDFSSQISYNDKGLVDFVYYNVNHLNGAAEDASTWSYYYAYDSSSLINYVDIDTPSGSAEERFTYDIFDRVSGKVYSGYVSGSSTIGFENEVEYTYTESGDNTSAKIATYESAVNGSSVTYTYTYDQNGYITKINYSTGQEIRYVYDELGQLLREDNGLLNATYLYTYDDAGNILTKKYCPLTAGNSAPTQIYATYDYSYSSSAWGDLLTEYLGRDITYDDIGNPLSYYNGFSYTFTWCGRELVGAVKDGKTYSFTYNDEGIRTSKTKNGVTTTYYLNGSQILAEETNGNITVYIYDSEGLPLGMQYHGASYEAGKWDTFWYEKNLFGDIVAIYNESGTKLMSYSYDAFGNCTPLLHVYSDAAYNNPFRYRGYYYDIDLNLYYLNSRYYDSFTGRFISADKIDTVAATPNALTDKNLFAYCDNNPVMRRDDGGQFWDTAFDVVSLAFSVAEVLANPADPWAWAGLVGDTVDLIPFVSGVGEATDLMRIANKADDFVDAIDDIQDTTRAIDRIDDGIDASKAISKTGKGTQNPNVKAAVQKGQAMHKQMDYGPGVLKEQTIAPGCRVDGIDFNNHIIYELKPNNPRAISRGMNQLNRYTSAASQRFGGKWIGVLKLYD